MEESATPSINILYVFAKWESWCQSSVLIVTLRGSKLCLNFITFTSFSHPPSFRSYYFTVIHILDWLRMHNENSFDVSLLTILAVFSWQFTPVKEFLWFEHFTCSDTIFISQFHHHIIKTCSDQRSTRWFSSGWKCWIIMNSGDNYRF